jgi:hypothetical protein
MVRLVLSGKENDRVDERYRDFSTTTGYYDDYDETARVGWQSCAKVMWLMGMRRFILYRDGPSCFQTFRLCALSVPPLRRSEFVSAIGRLPYSGTRCWNRFRLIGGTSLRIQLQSRGEREQAVFASRTSLLGAICILNTRIHQSLVWGERGVRKGRLGLGCDWCDIPSISSL